MNKVMLIGNVGQEPEVRYVDAGVAVAKLTLATTERGYTLQNGTQVPDRTDWHRIILWKRLAEVVEKYVHKGDKLYIDPAKCNHCGRCVTKCPFHAVDDSTYGYAVVIGGRWGKKYAHGQRLTKIFTCFF